MKSLISVVLLSHLVANLLPTVTCKPNSPDVKSFIPPEAHWNPSDASHSPPDYFETPDVFEKKSISRHHKTKLRLKDSELYLPRNVVPISYKLKIRPILESTNEEEFLTAPGSVDILVRCKEATSSVILHAHTRNSIHIFEESLKVETRSTREPRLIKSIGQALEEKEDADFYEISLSETLIPEQEYSIYMEFRTKISNTTLAGLYLSTYIDPESGEKKYLATTQFEDIAARQMFPCFDQPDMKASFRVCISRSADYNTMSNMPLVSTVHDPEAEGYVLDHFAPTPKMSTYLVAIIVSDFKCETASTTHYNKSVQACGPPHLIDASGGKHAAEVSAKLLNFYEELWDEPYPLPKMQSVAIPDFEAGAMENYGLNTYRIGGLLYFPGRSTESNRYSIESTIAHELAHQNFGNFVTCKSWNHIFLNEGFATYVSFIGIKEISPEFVPEELWYRGYVQRALRADSDPDIHPLVKTEDYFGDFDSISYSKGASLIKMMENLISRDTLVHGLRNYLDSYSYGNTEYHNLFETLDAQAHLNKTHPRLASISQIMDEWTIQPGFPLVRVSWTFERMFLIQQGRFLKFPYRNSTESSSSSRDETSNLWHIPIFITTSSELQEVREVEAESEIQTESHVKPKLWLTNQEANKVWTVKESIDWIIVNPASKAFVRIVYDEKLSNGILQQLNKDFSVFDSTTRAQLIDDGFESAWARYSSIESALERTKYLSSGESNPIVWSTALGHFGSIYAMLSNEPEALSPLKSYLRPRISSAIKTIGMEQLPADKGRVVMQRDSLFVWASALELPEVLDYTEKLVTDWKESNEELSPIPVDVRGTVYCAAVTKGGQNIIDFLQTQYAKESDPAHKRQLITAMGCSKNEEVLSRLFAKTLDEELGFWKSDSMALLEKLISNGISRNEAFKFIRGNFVEIKDYFGTIESVTWLLGVFSRYWNTEDQLMMVTEFVNEISGELESTESVNKTITRIQENIAWMGIYSDDIAEWLNR